MQCDCGRNEGHIGLEEVRDGANDNHSSTESVNGGRTRCDLGGDVRGDMNEWWLFGAGQEWADIPLLVVICIAAILAIILGSMVLMKSALSSEHLFRDFMGFIIGLIMGRFVVRLLIGDE